MGRNRDASAAAAPPPPWTQSPESSQRFMCSFASATGIASSTLCRAPIDLLSNAACHVAHCRGAQRTWSDPGGAVPPTRTSPPNVSYGTG
jgi:hypothetical protein